MSVYFSKDLQKVVALYEGGYTVCLPGEIFSVEHSKCITYKECLQTGFVAEGACVKECPATMEPDEQICYMVYQDIDLKFDDIDTSQIPQFD